MKLTWKEFSAMDQPAPVIIDSLDQALYQVVVIINAREYRLIDDNGRTFRRHNLQQVREALQLMPVKSITLRHRSAYDEMIGQPTRQAPNTLEVPVAISTDTPPTVH